MQYFTKETDKALAEFLKSENTAEKHEIFDKRIRPAFEKLIENQIYVYRFFQIDDVETLKKECLTNLYEMIPKFKPELGTKGFSYFNVICKNWFIQKSREKSKKARNESELYYDLDHEHVKSDPAFSVSPYEDQVTERERWLQFYDEMASWRNILKKKTEQQVLEAVIFIMKNPDLTTIYNKKAIYLYIREMTGLNTKQVVVNLKKIRGLYDKWAKKYNESGENTDSERLSESGRGGLGEREEGSEEAGEDPGRSGTARGSGGPNRPRPRRTRRRPDEEQRAGN